MRWRISAVLPILAILAGQTGCQRPATDNLFELNGRMFIFNYRIAYATYVITLLRVRDIEDGMRFVATFENPAGGNALVVERKIFPAQAKLVIESPHIECVRKERPYGFEVKIFDAAGGLIQSLEGKVKSSLDQSILPALPLTKGPAYDRNEIAYNANGEIILRDMTACPK